MLNLLKFKEMAKKKYKTKKAASKGVSEPGISYGKAAPEGEIQFFSSFEEMNKADIDEMRQYTPAQRFEHVTHLIKKLYAKELKKKFDFKIHFD
jgi:hypothetical protein